MFTGCVFSGGVFTGGAVEPKTGVIRLIRAAPGPPWAGDPHPLRGLQQARAWGKQ